jgi:hypothetical protein
MVVLISDIPEARSGRRLWLQPYHCWRVFYGLATASITTTIFGLVLRVADRIVGPARIDNLLGKFEENVVRSGWPHQDSGWLNIHLSEALLKVRRVRKGVGRFRWRPGARPMRAGTRIASRARNTSRLHVAFYGKFAGLLGFPPTLFAAAPSGVRVSIVDVRYGNYASNLAGIVERYRAGDSHTGRNGALRDAAWLNKLDADVTVLVDEKEAYEVADALQVGCVAHYCNGSSLLYHPRVHYQYYCQPQADCFPVGDRLFCATTQAAFGSYRIARITPLYDRRGLNTSEAPTWDSRDPLITFHGSLYKLAHRNYLSVLFTLMKEFAQFDFAFMGKDNGHALNLITDMADQHGLTSRVHYLGTYNAVREPDGSITDPRWQEMIGLLKRARLAANPWPLGGGSARVESYLLGVPCVSLRVNYEPEWWRRRQLVASEVTELHVPFGTGRTPNEYLGICSRVLTDAPYAERLRSDQFERAQLLTDPQRWWRQFVAGYSGWCEAIR